MTRARQMPVIVTPTWARRFMALAQVVGSWSKDPSTKVGAVIVDRDRHIVSTGYNGFPAGVNDDPDRYLDREFKLDLIVHAEVNAVLFAGRRLDGCVLVATTFPCSRCMGVILQSGVREILCPNPSQDERLHRPPWAADHVAAKLMLYEAGGGYIIAPPEEVTHEVPAAI